VSTAPVLQLEQVKKSYELGDVTVHALRGLDLSVPRGEFLAVVGASGSGKSTLMNILGLLDRPTTGRYLLEGQDVSGFDKDQRAVLRNRKIGFVFQNFNLLARTSALENVELPLLYNAKAPTPTERHQRARAMLEAVGLSGRADHTPSQLSGGQQQRVAIARALVGEPEIVLADEPTANLDHKTGEGILALMRDINRRSRTTFIFSTHDKKVIDAADRLVTIEDGVMRLLGVRKDGQWQTTPVQRRTAPPVPAET